MTNQGLIETNGARQVSATSKFHPTQEHGEAVIDYLRARLSDVQGKLRNPQTADEQAALIARAEGYRSTLRKMEGQS